MKSLSELSEEDLVTAFGLEESEWDVIEGLAIPERFYKCCSTMKEKRKRSRPKAVPSPSPPAAVADPSKPPQPSRKVRKETLDLLQLLAWKRSLPHPADPSPSIPSPKATRRPHPRITLEEHLRDLQYRSAQEEERQSKRRQLMADGVVQHRETPKQFPFETSAPMVWVTKEDQKRMEVQVRYQNRMQTRELLDRVLSLDLFEDVNKDRLARIPDHFEDGAEYISAFKPAFFGEMHENLINSLGDAKAVKAVPFWLRMTAKQAGLAYLASETTRQCPLSWLFKTGDIVLCTSGGHVQGVGKLAKPTSTYFLGICEKKESPGEAAEVHLKCRESAQLERAGAEPQLFSLVHIDSMLTMEREYRMLHLAEFLDLKSHLLAPAPPVNASPPVVPLPPSLNLNPSQSRAVLCALDPVPGFSLIQGPPGTGKTHTLISILSMLLQQTTTRKSGILVCAPSNAAIDEVVSRAVKSGILSSDGKPRMDCRLVRVGNPKKDELRDSRCIHRKDPKAEVMAVTLERLIQDKLTELGLVEDLACINSLRTRLSKICSLISKADSSQLPSLHEQQRSLASALAQEKVSKAILAAKRRTVELDLLSTADVIFTTLSSAGSKQMERLSRRFEYVIIDEACQAVELSSLIPMQYRAQKVILIGDPMQLPATTFSEDADRCGYSRSLFERLMSNGVPVNMLQEQYRMVKEIREFPGECFYASRLVDGDMRRKCPNWLPGPEVLFVDLKSSHEVRDEDGTSISNPAEVSFICDLYDHFRLYHGLSLNIGIITPYRKQVIKLRQSLKAHFGKIVHRDIEVNTVDGFQGREKDVIVFSSVRSGDQIGFLADIRRLNVAITRAKYALWMVGKMETLQRHRTWAQLLGYIRQKHVFAHAGCFSEVRAVFKKRVNNPVTEPLRLSTAPAPACVKREPTNYSKLFNSMIPRNETKGGIMELIEARETRKKQ